MSSTQTERRSCNACGYNLADYAPHETLCGACLSTHDEPISVERHHSGIECYGTDRDGYYVSRLYIGYTEAEAVASFRDYLREQEKRGTWRSGWA